MVLCNREQYSTGSLWGPDAVRVTVLGNPQMSALPLHRGAEHPPSSSKRLCTSGHLQFHGSFCFRDPEALVGCYCLKQWGDPTRDPAQLCHPPSLPPLCQGQGSEGLLFCFCSSSTHSAHPSSVGYARIPNEVSAVDTEGVYASKRFML